jgi:cell division topological specificity factor MinE
VVAKDRLSLIIASQRGSQALEHVNMSALQADIMAIIQKHVNVKVDGGEEGVKFVVKSEGEVNLLEMQIQMGNAIGGR